MSIPDPLFYGKTITGRRENNEDSFLSERISATTLLLAVADGMGGAVAGEVASKSVINELLRFVKSEFERDPDPTDLKSILTAAYDSVQYVVKNLVDANVEYAGMGTTLTVLLIHKQKYVWGNIGDSRLYKLSKENISQLTRDHTHIQDLIDKGETPDKEYIALYSNLITKCINGQIEIPDIYPEEADFLTIEDNSAFILCSDGLILKDTDDENSKRIHEQYQSEPILEKAPDTLINNAFELGSKDNITVVVAEFGKIEKIKAARKGAQITRNKGIKYIAYFLVVVLLGLLLLLLRQNGIKKGSVKDDPGTEEFAPWVDQFTEQDYPYSSGNDKVFWTKYPDSGNIQEIQLILSDRSLNKKYPYTDTLNSGSVSLKDFNKDLFVRDTNLADTARHILELRIQALLKNDSIVYGDKYIIEIESD